MPTAGSLRDTRLVVVSIYYTPEDTGIAPYATAMAEHYASQGAHVTALVGMPHYPGWTVDPEFRRRLRHHSTVKGVDVRRFRIFVPRSQTAARRALYEATFLAQARACGRLGHVDAAIGIIPNLSGGLVAASIARSHGCPLGIVVQDLAGAAAAQSGIPGGSRVARLTSSIEGWVMRQADDVAVVSDGFRPFLRAQGVDDDRVTAMPNWCRMARSKRDPAAVRADLGWEPGTTIVLHAGNMGLKQGLEHVIDAARSSGAGASVRFVFMGDGSQRRTLERRAEGLQNVTFIPARYGDAFADSLSAADVLLINERGSVLDMSLPSKLTSYFAAGRPVLAAVASGGVTAREVTRSGGGLVIDAEEPAALLAGVTRLVDDPDLVRRLADAGRRYASEHLSETAALGRAEQFAGRLLVSHARDTGMASSAWRISVARERRHKR